MRNFNGMAALLGLGLGLLGGKVEAQVASDFAARVVDFANLGSGIYGDPNSVLGKPTTWMLEPGNPNPIPCTMVYGAWNTAPDGSKLITTLGSSQQTGRIVVEFDPPITPDPFHWYGKDFIVFGNAFFSADAVVTGASDLNSVHIVSPNIFSEPVTISVSPDGLQWYTYSSPVADSYFPTQAYQWSSFGSGSQEEMDWTKPVPSYLTPDLLVGLSVADAIAYYDGSAGGTAFSIAASGFNSVRYIKAESRGGEVDGFARVGFVTTNVVGKITLEGKSSNSVIPVATFTFTSASGATITRTHAIGVNGIFTIRNIPLTTHTVRVSCDGWLTRQTTIVTGTGGVPGSFGELNLTLKAGDANFDNAVDIADLSLLIAHYNQTQGVGNYLEAVDFTGDGTNDIADLLLLIGNYNVVGE